MNRRELLTLAAGAVAAEILSSFQTLRTSLGADAGTNAPVVLTRTDGTVLKGKITSYDRDKVTMDVIARLKDPPVATDIAWSDIKRISNGLTREMALQKWKADHRDSLCKTCHGDGVMFCPTCRGIAHDPAASADCPTCKGAVQLPCKTAKCDHGTIPCTNPKCLKLTDPGWYTKADGLKWKKFNFTNGYAEFSEHHVGQVIDKVDGQWQAVGTCPVCAGLASLTDPVCRGTSKMPCPTCLKRTKSPPCPDHCDGGVVECLGCRGTGLKM